MSSLSSVIPLLLDALLPSCGVVCAALFEPRAEVALRHLAGAAPEGELEAAAALARACLEAGARVDDAWTCVSLGEQHVLAVPRCEHPALDALATALGTALESALEEARAGSLFHSVAEGIIVLRGDGCCELINAYAVTCLGVEPGQARGQLLWSLCDCEPVERAWRLAQRGEPARFATRRDDGQWWQITATREYGYVQVRLLVMDPTLYLARGEMFISQVSEASRRAETPSQVLTAAASKLRELGGWSWAEVWLSESNSGPLRLHTIEAELRPEFAALRERSEQLRFELGMGAPWEAVLRSGAFLLELDERFVRAAEARAGGLTHGLFLPVMDRGRIFGVLGFLHDRPLVSAEWEELSDRLYERLRVALARQIEWLESQILFDLSRDMIMLLSVDGTVRRMNPSLERTLGWPMSGLSPDAFLVLTHPDDVEVARSALVQVSSAGNAELVNIRMRHARGGYRWISWTAQALPEHGVIYAIGRDITSAQRAAAELTASEQRFRLVARATSDAVWDWDLGADTLWWGDGYTTLFGYPAPGPDATLESSWACYIHPEDMASTVRGIHAAVESGASDWRAEYRFICADGREAWVMDRAYVIRDERGAPLRMVGGMTDLSARKAAELERAWQAELLDQTMDAILVERLDGEVRYWNRAATGIFGVEGARIVGGTLRAGLALDHDALDLIRAQTIERGSWAGEFVIALPGGKAQVLDMRWTLLHDGAGEPEELLAVATDISQRKQIELQYLRAQRLESVGTLAGGIAHDLNNILTPIMMSASLLQMELDDPDALDLVSDIASAAKRGAEIIQQILSFARGAEGRRASIDPGTLLRDVARIGQESFMRTIEILTEIPDTMPAVLGDATQLHQVLLNLMINARDAMPDGGTLTLSAEPVHLDASYVALNQDAVEGDYIVLSISDTGTGIEEAIRDRIFEPFFTTKAVGQGSGLGLSTVLAIIRGHEGFIHLYSELDRGTTFKLYLPSISADVPLREDTPKPLPRGQGELILLVDDEPAILGTTRQMLEAFGYRVIIASDGADALGTYAAHKDSITVVLTDVMMPFMDGIAMARAMLRMNPKARIIAASGLNAHGTTARLLDVGVREFLPKPFTADTLLLTLRDVIERE